MFLQKVSNSLKGQSGVFKLLSIFSDAVEADSYFSFIPMDIHINFEQLFFPGTDNGYAVLPIPGGFPFSDTVYTEVYVSLRGKMNRTLHIQMPNCMPSLRGGRVCLLLVFSFSLLYRLDQMEYCHLVPLTIHFSIKNCQSPAKHWWPHSGMILTPGLEVE